MLVRDLMSHPAVTCGAEATLADGGGDACSEAEIGSIVVIDDGKVAGILTERDLLRAAAAGADPSVGAGPALDDGQPRRARTRGGRRRGLDEPVAPPLPPPAGRRGRAAGRRRLDPGPLRRGQPPAGRRARGRRAARGSRAWSWPPRPSATSAGARASTTTASTRRSTSRPTGASRTSGISSSNGELPDRRSGPAFAAEVRTLRAPPRRPGSSSCPDSPRRAAPLDVLRTAVSLFGAELGWRPVSDEDAGDRARPGASRLSAAVPTILATAYRIRNGLEPVEPRRDRSRLRGQLPLDADRGRTRARRTPGRSSST